MTKEQMRIRLKTSLLGLLLLVQLATLNKAITEAQPEDTLSALEMRVLGEKHPNEPILNRITRLEQLFQLAGGAKYTIQFRLSRLHDAQNAVVSTERQKAAVRAYNNGVDAADQGRYEQAATLYREAIRLNPNRVEAYNNLGSLLERLQKYPEALEVYHKAIARNPTEVILYRNIGVVYEKLGNVEAALKHYRLYLQHSNSKDPVIANIIKSYDAKRNRWKDDPDYLDLARNGSQGEKLIWPRNMIPIPVYIQIEPDQTEFLPAIRDAFSQWEAVSEKRIRFKEVGSPSAAWIQMHLREGPLSHPDLEVGYASYDVIEDERGQQRQLKVSIVVNTGERDAPIALTSRLAQVKRLALHELGHAIGIWGHSPSPEDIMYSHPIANQLSPRDIRTLHRLYGIHPVAQEKATARP